MNLEQANQAFEALQARVLAIEEGLANQASPAFIDLTHGIQALEEKLTTHGPMLEQLQTRLEPRFVAMEAKVTALEVANESNSFTKDIVENLGGQGQAGAE
ncbi:unnamed protein product [Mortierella alpina]